MFHLSEFDLEGNAHVTFTLQSCSVKIDLSISNHLAGKSDYSILMDVNPELAALSWNCDEILNPYVNLQCFLIQQDMQAAMSIDFQKHIKNARSF
jgi:hypothetical protein